MKNQKLQNLLTVLENVESNNQNSHISFLNEDLSKKLVGGDAHTNFSCINSDCQNCDDNNMSCTNNGCGGNGTNEGCKNTSCL